MGRVNWLVMAFLLVCYLVAFALGIAAEQHRSKAIVTYVGNSTIGNNSNTTSGTNSTGYYYCKYDSDISSSYGAAAFVFLIISQVVLMGVTRCFCGDGEHKPGAPRTCAFISFCLLWLCFAIAEICFLAGANKNSIRSRSQSFSTGNATMDKFMTCDMLSKGLFGAAAAFTFFTGLSGEIYFICLVLSRKAVADLTWQGRDGPSSTGSSSSMNRPAIPGPYALGGDGYSSTRPSPMMNQPPISSPYAVGDGSTRPPVKQASLGPYGSQGDGFSSTRSTPLNQAPMQPSPYTLGGDTGYSSKGSSTVNRPGGTMNRPAMPSPYALG